MEPMTMMALGGASSLLGGLFGGSSARKAARLQRQMFQKAIAEAVLGRTELRGAAAGANEDLFAALTALEGGGKKAERRLLAASVGAEDRALDTARAAAKASTGTAYGRGMAGTTIGSNMMTSMLRNPGLLGLDTALQLAGQQANLAMSVGQGLAGVRGQMAQTDMQLGQGLNQSRMAVANMMGQFQPIVDTSMGDMFSSLGGSALNIGALGAMGAFTA